MYHFISVAGCIQIKQTLLTESRKRDSLVDELELTPSVHHAFSVSSTQVRETRPVTYCWMVAHDAGFGNEI